MPGIAQEGLSFKSLRIRSDLNLTLKFHHDGGPGSRWKGKGRELIETKSEWRVDDGAAIL